MSEQIGKGLNNITLIGMPASGKSSIGVVLAKRLGMDFLDTDLIIQQRHGMLLKDLIAKEGNREFRRIENEVNASLQVENTIIAPGGSVIYGKQAMEHLKNISTIIYLELTYKAILVRIGDLTERGVSLEPGQNLKSLYKERKPLYEKYADFTINEMRKTTGKIINEICDLLREKGFKSERL